MHLLLYVVAISGLTVESIQDETRRMVSRFSTHLHHWLYAPQTLLVSGVLARSI